MRSHLLLAELHWEHEPGAAGRARSPLRADGGQGTGRPTKSRFMERETVRPRQTDRLAPGLDSPLARLGTSGGTG